MSEGIFQDFFFFIWNVNDDYTKRQTTSGDISFPAMVNKIDKWTTTAES